MVLAEVIRAIAAVDPAIAQVPQAHFLFVDVLATVCQRETELFSACVTDWERHRYFDLG